MTRTRRRPTADEELRPELRQTQPAETQPAETRPAETRPAGTADHPATAVTGGRRARAGSARLAPQALADARGEALEGLDWLGREPESRASILYRALRLLARFVLFGVFRFRIRTSGTEHLPRGGYLLVAAAHRGWMDPFVALHAMPASPRAWFLGSAPSTFTSRTREWLIRRVGGLLPVWRGGVGIEQHVRAARAVVANGGVFVQMPEGTINGPAGRIGTFRNGWALIALRTRAPIVPFAMAGTEDLYLGKRMASRVLPPTSVEDLLGAPAPVASPAQGSKQELELARRLTDALAARIGPVVEELQPWTIDPPGHPRRLRRWLTWLLLHPGGINRER